MGGKTSEGVPRVQSKGSGTLLDSPIVTGTVESPLSTGMKTKLEGHSLAGGLELDLTGETVRAVDPAEGRALDPEYHCVDPTCADAIARQAWDAFMEYRRRPDFDRASFLRLCADHIEDATEDLIERMPLETALPEARVRGELARTLGQLRLFAALVEDGSWVDARIETAQPDRKPLPRPDIRSMLHPVGPVVVFCAGNFPLAFSVAGGDTAAALATGNPVIVKAHHSHPGVAEIVGRAMIRAMDDCGLPDGVFSLIHGQGNRIGTALVRQPQVRAVGFTGSRRGGTALMKVASEREHPIPVFAEMSSINPVFVFENALRRNGGDIARGLAASVTLGLGQFCTNPGLVVLPRGAPADEFARNLARELAGTPDGDALNAGIASAYHAALRRLELRKDEDIKVHRSSRASPGSCRMGTALFEVTAAAFLRDASLQQEAFGPASLLVTWKEEEELQRMVRSLEGQLTGTVHATSMDMFRAGPVIEILQQKVGRLLFNDFPTGVEVCHAMVHGGPWPSTSDGGRSTSVGTLSIRRFVRPFCYQNAPDPVLPPALRNDNPLGIGRLVDGEATEGKLE